MVGGRDGDKSQAAFWALVVANAFRVIVIGASIILALVIVMVVQYGQYGGTIPGVLIWTLISGPQQSPRPPSVPSVTPGAGPGTEHRAGLRGRHGRARVIDLSVLGWNSLVSDGAPVSMMLLAGTFVVIVFGLTVPGPMRQAVTRPAAIAGTGSPGPRSRVVRRHGRAVGASTRRPHRRAVVGAAIRSGAR